MRDLKDILLIDKPKGITSYDVIRILKRKLGIKKIGHAGTLDPQATGLLIIGIGKGTKKLNEFLKLPKVYLMEVILGIKTETGDLEGKILEEKEVKKISPAKIKKNLKEMEREITLSVPLYSAIKIQGKPLYKLARSGMKIKPPKRKMKIYSLKLEKQSKKDENYILKIEMRCAAGTYARSVAEEIGRRLGCPATLGNLRRSRIGSFDVKNSQRL